MQKPWEETIRICWPPLFLCGVLMRVLLACLLALPFRGLVFQSVLIAGIFPRVTVPHPGSNLPVPHASPLGWLEGPQEAAFPVGSL